jgi:hypothetical protein
MNDQTVPPKEPGPFRDRYWGFAWDLIKTLAVAIVARIIGDALNR